MKFFSVRDDFSKNAQIFENFHTAVRLIFFISISKCFASSRFRVLFVMREGERDAYSSVFVQFFFFRVFSFFFRVFFPFSLLFLEDVCFHMVFSAFVSTIFRVLRPT